MASKYKQDMPPAGGYGPIEWAKKIKKRGWGGYRTFGAYAAVSASGILWWYLHRKREARALLEMNDARIALEPFIKAERDRMYLRQLRSNRDEETELMKDVPGWKVGHFEGEPCYWNQANRFHHVVPEEYWMHNSWWDMYNRLYEKLMH